MKRIAIITARGGSKRIPKKNIKDFCGKPIIAYSIQSAIDSNLFDEVMVSTDSLEIANIAIQYGASVPFIRSAKTSDDFAPTAQVLLEVIEQYKQIGKTFDQICCIYPTAPFVNINKLQNATALMQNEDVQAVIPVVAFSFPPQRGFSLTNSNVAYTYPEFALTRSQDLTPQYHDCGQFYLIKTESFLQCKTLVPQKTKALIMPETEVQDIDNEIDWRLAEMKYKIMIGEQKNNG